MRFACRRRIRLDDDRGRHRRRLPRLRDLHRCIGGPGDRGRRRGRLGVGRLHDLHRRTGRLHIGRQRIASAAGVGLGDFARAES
jgi:hypothetical protein